MCLLSSSSSSSSSSSFRSLADSPCWDQAYLDQRMLEHQESGRCKCDVNKNTCDNCGSTVPAAIQTLIEKGYVSKNNKFRFSLVKEPIDVPINKQDLLHFLKQGPVICNMYIRKSQASFLDKPSSDSNVFGKLYADENGNDVEDQLQSDFYKNDLAFAFPPTNPSESKERYGHCVVIVGSNETQTKFRVRNSFGAYWGYNGDFFLTDQHIHPSTIHQLVFIPFSCIKIENLV